MYLRLFLCTCRLIRLLRWVLRGLRLGGVPCNILPASAVILPVVHSVTDATHLASWVIEIDLGLSFRADVRPTVVGATTAVVASAFGVGCTMYCECVADYVEFGWTCSVRASAGASIVLASSPAASEGMSSATV